MGGGQRRLSTHVSFMRHFFKYADYINTKYAAGICGNHLSYILWNELSRRHRRWPAPTTLALTSDNAIGLVGRQSEAVGRKFPY